jgi:soluble lytic murein transglycosylase
VLAFAAYNAGPGRAKRWSEVYGDPTSSKADQVDWIEHIPFNETRNYVMRVMESLHIYRARIAGKTPPLQLSKDLRKG